jgi:hypothetical protein
MSDAAANRRAAASPRRRRSGGLDAALRRLSGSVSMSADLSPLLAVLAGAGLLLIAVGNNLSREGFDGGQPLFWAGLVTIYAPITLRLCSRSATRRERLALSLLLGGALYLVKVIYSPTGFTLHDEFGTWRQTFDLIHTGQPFSSNPIVTGYAGFPSLELITSAVHQLAGPRIFIAATILIGVARVLLILGLFVFIERAADSSRVAGVAIAVYVCNPSFLYFDSQFGYESLALVVAVALLLVGQRWVERDSPGRDWNAPAMVATMAVLAATLALTHHMSSYAMTGFFAVWTLTIMVGAKGSWRPQRPSLNGPLLPCLLMGGAAVAWFAIEASHVTTSELGDVVKGAFESVIHLFVGDSSGSKKLFQSAGQTNTILARILGVASVVPLLAVIPLGLWRTWRGPEENPLWRALAIVAFFYPVTLLLRLTEAGTETSQRASEFVFVGLAFVCGLLIAGLPPLANRTALYGRALAGMALATVIFLGGFIVGESPVTRQPGQFLVGGEARATSPQGLAAARFAAAELPPGSRFISDRPNGNMIASYGGLTRVVGSIEGLQISRVFLSEVFDETDRRIVTNDAIDYIVVDRRLSHETPAGGYYYESSEPEANAYKEPVGAGALRKFNHVEGLNRIFDNGAIAIYDTAGIR